MTELSTGTGAGYSPETASDGLDDKLRAALAPNLLLVREIGAGGMARVFLAREPALKRLVAVKVLSGDLAKTDAGRSRFEREAQAVAALSHPNIVAVHTVGELADGTPYFIMQYVDGRSISERVEKEGPLSIAEARRALGEVAAALAAAHKAGIIHRDVKPANILYEDATGRVLVSDFGIAAIGRDNISPVNTKLTATGVAIGTPQYMSPEQLLAEPVTEKTDVYSVGLLAHEMLCGTPPFKSNSPHELIAAHLRDVPAKLSARRPDVDAELDAVVARCLEKDAAARPTAEEVAKRLVPGAGALLEWPPPGLEELHGRMRGMSSFYMAGGVTASIMMLIMVVAGTRLSAASFSPTTLLLAIGALAGSFVIGIGMQRTVKLARVASRAVASGYAWLTVLETMADVRGDTGNLIAGSREYAGLSPEQRDRYRRARVRREAALLLGGSTALPLMIAVMILGSLGVVGWWASVVPLLPPLTGLAMLIVLGWRERKAFARHRGRRAAPDVAALASPWYAAFETVRQGQRLGRGPSGFAKASRWIAVGAVGVLAFAVLLFVPLTAAGTLAPQYWGEMVPLYANTEGKMRIGDVARPYELPNDPRITPSDAGRAWHVLLGQKPEPNASFPENPLPERITSPWESPTPEGILTAARQNAQSNTPNVLTIWKDVHDGVTTGERAYLQSIATAPHWRHWDLLARASTFDYLGARYRLPWGPEANIWALPVLPVASTKQLAYASVSRAAYHHLNGRRDSVETVLRGTISVGFLMADHANTLLERLVGIVVTGIGRQGLIDYWKLVGDPRASVLRARLDSAIAHGEEIIAPSAGFFGDVDMRDAAALRQMIMRRASNPREPRSNRFALLAALGQAPCTNLRELVFGVTHEVRAVFDSQRVSLVRFPSDSATLELMLRQTDANFSGVFTRSATGRAARIIGALLGNDRVPVCVEIMRNTR